MRFVTYAHNDSQGRAGVQLKSAVVDAAECARRASIDGDVDWASVKAIVAGAGEGALEQLNLLLTPTVPIAATPIDEREVDIGGYQESVRSAVTRLTGPTNLTGFPSLSGPCGSTASGLPVGVQLIGRPFDEAGLYRFGYAYEAAVAGVRAGR